MANIWDAIFGSAITANFVLAAPNGSAGPLSPRALVAADIPAVNWSALTGTLSNGQVIPYGDAGISRIGAHQLAIGNGSAGDASGTLSVTTIDLFGSIFDFFGTSGSARQFLMSIGSVPGVEWQTPTFADISGKTTVAQQSFDYGRSTATAHGMNLN